MKEILSMKCFRCLGAIVVALTAACGSSEGDPEPVAGEPAGRLQLGLASAPAGGKVYERIEGGVPGCYEKTRPCERLQVPGVRFGIYRVESLTGYTERTPEGGPTGVTYVGLTLMGGPGPHAPTAKLPGGPVPDGRDFHGSVSLAKGEVLGLILHPTDITGQYSFDVRDVFREKGDGFVESHDAKVPGSLDGFLLWADNHP